MKVTQDTINENNYVLREIKEITGKQNIALENIEILEDLAEIHEIKDLKNEQKIPLPQIIQNNNYEVEIKLEGEPAEKRIQNNIIQKSEKTGLCPDCINEDIIKEQNNEVLCNECKQECMNENQNEDINEGEEHVHFGFVNAPFLERNEEEAVMVNEDITNLIETIFEKLKSDDVLNDAHNLKITFNVLKENDKNEVIEGIKIKIDNEEQENRFNNLLKLLL